VGSVLLQPHVLRRVAAARLRHRSPLLASSPGCAPEGFWLPTKGRAARWERVRVVEIWVNNEVGVGWRFSIVFDQRSIAVRPTIKSEEVCF
jgi:hypothetical protein